MEIWPAAGVIAAVFISILVPFVVVPEIFERRGYNPRSAWVRGVVWASFLTIIFIPAVATGYVFTIKTATDWLLGLGFLVIAVIWDYYRLNPEKVTWAKPRG